MRNGISAIAFRKPSSRSSRYCRSQRLPNSCDHCRILWTTSETICTGTVTVALNPRPIDSSGPSATQRYPEANELPSMLIGHCSGKKTVRRISNGSNSSDRSRPNLHTAVKLSHRCNSILCIRIDMSRVTCCTFCVSDCSFERQAGVFTGNDLGKGFAEPHRRGQIFTRFRKLREARFFGRWGSGRPAHFARSVLTQRCKAAQRSAKKEEEKRNNGSLKRKRRSIEVDNRTRLAPSLVLFEVALWG